jgi:hypothetical protein
LAAQAQSADDASRPNIGDKSPGRSRKMKPTPPIAADVAALARLAQALAFICGGDHPTTLAMQKAAASGNPEDIKKARALFVQLKPGSQKAALSMIEE